MMIENIDNLQQQIERMCRFCNPPEKERILFETENFYVMVSLGPIVEGYLLIVTKGHIGACLNMPEPLHREFLTLKEKVGHVLTEVYGGCIFYEHGKIGTSLMTTDHRHCFHAHLHCVPSQVRLNSIISKELVGKHFATMQDCLEKMRGVDRYLFVDDGEIMTYQPKIQLPSQYLRKVFAKAEGVEERWNWIEMQNWAIIIQSVEKLKTKFDDKTIS